jgi:hypothetical protein
MMMEKGVEVRHGDAPNEALLRILLDVQVVVVRHTAREPGVLLKGIWCSIGCVEFINRVQIYVCSRKRDFRVELKTVGYASVGGVTVRITDS